ncbi:MAG: DUF362 domain-containing protein [Thermodesulfobacteriota bacterium]
MGKKLVAIVRYEKPYESVKKAVELSHGLDHLPNRAKVFIKPNIVFWSRSTPFPKWGVITTSRIVEDMVILLKDRGTSEITLLEGTITFDPKDRETPAHAFESLGYNVLKKRYGIKIMNVFERPFQRIDLGKGVILNFNEDILEGDFLVNLPVLKTHAQTIVSLGIKNLKGLIDVPSRKMCHSPDPQKNLHFMVSQLSNRIPPSFTLIDGIYTTERGPFFEGRIRRTNLLVASSDILSADMVGAKVLGYDPNRVPHLAFAAQDRNRPADLSDIEIVGEKIEEVSSLHEYAFPYTEDGTLPKALEKLGVKGLSYPKYDETICTYCSGLTTILLMAISHAWKGEPWDEIEILTGKKMKPNPGKKKTILIGHCMVKANQNHPNIKEGIPVGGCPPDLKEAYQALQRAGIEVSPHFFDNMDMAAWYFMKRYEGKPEFDESFFKVS